MGNINKVSSSLFSEIKSALESVNYGSIEIIVQNKIVTQITVRNIHKTSVEIKTESTSSKSDIENKVYIGKSTL